MAVQTQIQARRGTAATWTSTNPTLAAGETGFETDTGKFKIGTGSLAWNSLAYAGGATAVTYLFNATAGQTTFSGADANGLTLAYTVGAEQVYLNGVLQVRGSDYTATNGTSIVLTSGALVSDVLNVIAYSAMTITDTYTQAQADAKFYQIASNNAANKNAIINGGMDIWQRGTSFTNGGQYTADRWYFDISASTVTSTRESTIVPAGFQYSWKVSKSAGSSTATLMGQTIETANAIQFAGKTVTVSFYAAADTATTFTPVLTYSTSVDNPRSGSWTNITPTVNGSTSVSTTTFVRIVSTFAVPSTAKSLFMYIEPTVTSGANIYVTGFQLELGSIVSQFARAGGTIQGELAACQRYYWRNTPGAAYGVQTFGATYTTNVAFCGVIPPVTMRVAPTSVDYSNLQVFDPVANASYAVSSLSLASATIGSMNIGIEATASGATAGRPSFIRNNNNTAGYLGFSAEL